MHKIMLLFWALMLGLGLRASAQLEQPVRLEIPLERHDNFFEVVSAEEEGLVLYRINNKNNKDYSTDRWELRFVDEELKERWQKMVYMDRGFYLTGYDLYEDQFFMLFQNPTKRNGGYRLLVVPLNGKAHEVHELNNVVPLELTEFEIIGNSVLLAGTYNGIAAVMLHEYASGKIKVIPGFYDKKNELMEVKVNDNRDAFTVLMKERSLDRKTWMLTLQTFDMTGQRINRRIIPFDGENNLISATTNVHFDRHEFVMGTYSPFRSDYSRGIFVAKMNLNEVDGGIKYYNYGELNNFFAYLGERRENRIKNRILKRKEKGKKLKFNYRVNVYDVKERDGEYVFIGEAYYPKYTNTAASGYNTYSSRYGGYGTNFEGYVFTHAVVVGFDKEGNFLWDNSFTIRDITSYNLRNFVDVDLGSDQMLVMLYVKDNVIRSKVVQGNEVLEGKEFTDLMTDYEHDDVRNNFDDEGDLAKWYDDYFYAYGVQRIRNKVDPVPERNRKVFFINKVNYNYTPSALLGEADATPGKEEE